MRPKRRLSPTSDLSGPVAHEHYPNRTGQRSLSTDTDSFPKRRQHQSLPLTPPTASQDSLRSQMLQDVCSTNQPQSVAFAQVSYTSTGDQAPGRNGIGSSQAPDAMSPAEPTTDVPRGEDRHHDHDRMSVQRSSGMEYKAPWNHVTLPGITRRTVFTARKNRWQSLPSDRKRSSSPAGMLTPNLYEDTSLRAAGVDDNDFASFLPIDDHSHGWTSTELHSLDDFNRASAGRAASWTPRIRDERRRSYRLSLPANMGRTISGPLEAIFGSGRRQSILARLTEGVLVPTTEEIATLYSTPSIAAFALDLEKGLDDPDGPLNPARSLTRRELLVQRIAFTLLVLGLNSACIIASATGNSGAWVLAVILFFKAKDFLSVWLQIICRIYYWANRKFRPIEGSKHAAWILSLIPAYSESEEQIVKTLFSLRDNGLGNHKQVMCIVLDGKHRPIRSHMTKVVASFSRHYVSLKWKSATLQIDAGFVDDIPTLCIEKIPNAGKKDSLVLCHDLFNFPREDMHPEVRALREELRTSILPQLTGNDDFPGFDLIFCTDADSTIHKGALASLANACLAEPDAIAACGFVFVEYEPGLEWSIWNLYQQFQYCFGQIVRRGAEHYNGKVTCLPGCITMIVVREEMAGAIEKYAKPVTSVPVLRHQVQYLGTDRRLTYCMLSQAPYLRTLFVPEAGSETVAPQSLKHYLSQRRRWGSNAYANNFFYLAGRNMNTVTRIGAAIEILRLTMVYFRVVNTALFIKGVITHFDFIQLLPLIFVSFTPSVWFAFAVIFLNNHLRCNWYKLACGFCINRCISPFMSVTIFILVARNLGSQVWGISGVTANTPVTSAVAALAVADKGEAEVEVQ